LLISSSVPYTPLARQKAISLATSRSMISRLSLTWVRSKRSEALALGERSKMSYQLVEMPP
jgi:hypothetical protein